MKLILYEIKKVISQKVFITILVLSILLNGFILVYTQLSKPDNFKLTNAESYSETLSEYSALPTDKAIEKVNDRLLAYEILSCFQELATADDEELANIIMESLKDYQKNSPNAYAQAEKMSKSNDNNLEEMAILQDISAQLSYIKSYPAFINEMNDRAETQSKAKLFSDENSFSYKNLFKTAEDYQGLKNAELQIGKNSTVLAVGEFKITDYLLIAIAFLICVYLFSTEKEKGLYNLVRSTSKGRFATIISKLTALAFLTIVIAVIFTALNFAVTSCMYGADSLNIKVQSFSEFRNCILDLTVWQYYLIFIGSKAIALLAFSLIFALIFICFSSAGAKYICCGIVIGVQYLLYAFIPSDSPINFLKYINIFYFADSQQLLSCYLNLNIFGYAVNIFSITISVVLFIVLACSLIISILFVMKNQEVKASRLSVLQKNFKTKFFRINGSTSLFKAEIFKYLVQNKFALLFIALVCFSIFNCLGKEEYVYSSQSDVIYKSHMEYLSGEITPEKEHYISEKEQYVVKLEEKLNDPELSSGMFDVISNIIENETQALQRINSQYDRIKALEKTDPNANFIDENIYSRFILNPQREWLNFVFICLLIIIAIPIIYTSEYKNNVINLIRPSQKGKLRLWLCKLLTGGLAALVLFICVYTPYLIRFINGFGTKDFATSVRSIGIFENSMGLSVIGAFVLETITYLFIAIGVLSVVILISVFIENNLVSMLMSSVVVLIPCILINTNEKIRIGQIFCENLQLAFWLIILICILLASLLLVLSGCKFTRTKLFLRRGIYGIKNI